MISSISIAVADEQDQFSGILIDGLDETIWLVDSDCDGVRGLTSGSSSEPERLPMPFSEFFIGMADRRPIPCKKNCRMVASLSGHSRMTRVVQSISRNGQLTICLGFRLRDSWRDLKNFFVSWYEDECLPATVRTSTLKYRRFRN